MDPVIPVLEVGSDDFQELQQRLMERAERRDTPLGGQPGERLSAARESGDKEYNEFANEFYEGLHASALPTVERIIETVERLGDDALRHLSRLLDGRELSSASLMVSRAELMQLADGADEEILALCRDSILPRLRSFHQAQLPTGSTLEEHGGSVGVRVQPLRRVGVYMAGGETLSPTALMMAAVPAEVAGVEEIAVFAPPSVLEDSPLLAALLLELEIDEVYRIGGAQAVAAAAVGTPTVPRVDRFVGTGGVFVTLAKQMLSHLMGVDDFAGAGELVILFDEAADADMVAADLIAQAELDRNAAAIGITDSAEAAAKVAESVARRLADLPRASTARQALQNHGGLVLVPGMAFAARLSDTIAPQYCQVMTRNAERVAGTVRNAGTLLVGPFAPEAFSACNAGPGQMLPTDGANRWASGLSVHDFMRRVNVVVGAKDLLEAHREPAIRLARLEHREGRARSIEARGQA
jgi:histidinol dehydrogenase